MFRVSALAPARTSISTVPTNAVLSGDHVWGGGVAFDRTEIDENQFLTELRQTVGDDSLLSTYFDESWVASDHIFSR